MLNKKALAAARIASGTTTDADFEYVTMLLHGDGTNGAQNNTFIDGSTNNLTVTRNGNVTQGSLNPFGDRWSNYFDGNGDYLSISSSNTVISTTGDFTAEAWVYPTTVSDHTVFYIRGDTNGWAALRLGVSASQVFLLVSTNASAWQIASGLQSSVQANTWTHIAVTRNGGSFTVYVNGTSVYTSTAISSGTALMTGSMNLIGAIDAFGATGISELLTGYLSNVRVVNGTAVYTANFTPPTAPLTAITNTSLLTCQSNRFRDNSSNNFTITRNGDVTVTSFSPFSPSAAYSSGTNGGSGYFDGSGDFLTVPSNTALAFGTGDFTAECWLYRSSTATMVVMDYATSGGFGFYLTSTQIICFVSAGTAYTATATVAANTWAHIAFARSGTTLKTYLNGTEVGSFTVSTNFTSPSALTFGRNAGSGADQFSGYISNLRLVKGTAVYTANFTPPTAPLTAITNTSLLLNFTNGGIIDSAADNVLETVGNAQISTSVKKFGTGSLAFDGSADYLIVNGYSDALAFGNGNFTIEMWAYFNSFPSPSNYSVLYDARPSATNGAYAAIYTDQSNLYYYVNSANQITVALSTIGTGTWRHLAVCRSGTSTRMFVDGVQVGSTYTDNTVYLNPAQRPAIGGGGNALGMYSLNGYIDDLRITKGVARYTANFTPPTAAFPDL